MTRPPSPELLIKSHARLPCLPLRDNHGNKGTFGRVLVVAGSNEMIGAPAMAGAAALRMGAGLVQVAVPGLILSAVLSITPELIGLALSPSAGPKLLEAAEKAQAIVIGPGLGQSDEVKERVLDLIQISKPMVVDADAINILSRQKAWPDFFRAEAVLTPHPGEMTRLIALMGKKEVPNDDDGRLQIAIEVARAFKQVVVLKGNKTVVTDGIQTYVNHTGNSSLAKAGTGDILSGMIGTLLAQKMKGFEAACLAVHLHGLAGEIAGRKLGDRSVLAHEVVQFIFRAILEYETNKP
jgi:hydroxyethylthiazole kinase-like uncharacterized protein yjeF